MKGIRSCRGGKWSLVLILLAGSMALFSQGLPLQDPVSFYAVENLPFLRRGVQTKQFSAYDRTGDNYDHEYFPLYTEPGGECVIFDAYGPGCLWRQHMNLWYMDSWDGRENFLEGIRIRYYFDDESKPRIDMDVSIFFSEENPLGVFKKPFAWNGEDKFRVLYLPIYFRTRLKVTLNREPGGSGSGEMPWMGHTSEIPDRGTRRLSSQKEPRTGQRQVPCRPSGLPSIPPTRRRFSTLG